MLVRASVLRLIEESKKVGAVLLVPTLKHPRVPSEASRVASGMWEKLLVIYLTE